jgi:predicted DNA-binding transcriptional regulator AlpA
MTTLNLDYSGQNICYSQNLRSLVNNSRSLFEKRIWRVKDVAEFVGCSEGHIYNLSSDEKIPKVKKGKFLYFIPDKILSWIEEGEVEI